MKQIFLCLIALSIAVPHASALTGEKIIQKSTSLFRTGVKNEREVVEITVVSGSQKKEKVLTRWSLYDHDQTKVAIAFSEPAMDKGQKTSIWLEPKGKVEQWLKLPSREAYLQISAINQDNIFVGNITHEMARLLAKEPTELFSYRILSQDIQQSIIEAMPKVDTESGFTKRLLWLDNKFAILKVEYYNSAGLAKIQTNGNITVDVTGRWRTDKIVIEDKQRGGSTTLDITIRKINEKLPPEIFTKDFLTSKRY